MIKIYYQKNIYVKDNRFKRSLKRKKSKLSHLS